MKQHYIDEKTGISYTLRGDYYLPDLTLPTEEETKYIGIWGQRHLNYIQKHCKPFYYKMLGEHTLYDYLCQINQDVEDMYILLVKQMAEREGVTEKLKAENQMEWVGKMNNIRQRATEVVRKDLIYT